MHLYTAFVPFLSDSVLHVKVKFFLLCFMKEIKQHTGFEQHEGKLILG